MSIIQVKAGSSINWPAGWTVNRVPQDLDDYDIVSQVRSTTGALVLEFGITVLDQTIQPGAFVLTATAEATAGLARGVHDCDIQYRNTVTGQVEFTQTFQIEVTKSISQIAVN